MMMIVNLHQVKAFQVEKQDPTNSFPLVMMRVTVKVALKGSGVMNLPKRLKEGSERRPVERESEWQRIIERLLHQPRKAAMHGAAKEGGMVRKQGGRPCVMSLPAVGAVVMMS